MVDPRGSGLLSFHVYKAPPLALHPYTCLGIEWLTQGGVVYYFHVYKAPPLHLFGN